MTFVDTNIIIDILVDEPRWADWSADRLLEIEAETTVFINAIIVAETSRAFERVDPLLERLEALGLQIVPLDERVAFVAGRRFMDYRRQRSADPDRRVLPDFFVGAHALVLGVPLLTRDPKPYRRYFPDLPLITPETPYG